MISSNDFVVRGMKKLEPRSYDMKLKGVPLLILAVLMLAGVSTATERIVVAELFTNTG